MKLKESQIRQIIREELEQSLLPFNQVPNQEELRSIQDKISPPREVYNASEENNNVARELTERMKGQIYSTSLSDSFMIKIDSYIIDKLIDHPGAQDVYEVLIEEVTVDHRGGSHPWSSPGSLIWTGTFAKNQEIPLKKKRFKKQEIVTAKPGDSISGWVVHLVPSSN